MKISSYEPVSSQKYENGYRTNIYNFTVSDKCELRAGSDEKKSTAQPRRGSNLGLPIAGRTL